MNLFVFSGRLRSGKDWIAEKIGCQILSIAEPMYQAADHFLGTRNKDLPYVRRFLQLVGAWGRGENPPTEEGLPTQEVVTKEFKENYAKIVDSRFHSVKWDEFGHNKNFWIDVTVSRANEETQRNPSLKLAIVNARFQEEVDAFKNAGFVHFHVKCSNETRIKRIGEHYDPKMELDVTEAFSAKMDKDLTGTNVLWNDDAPNPGFTLASEFIRENGALQAPTSFSGLGGGSVLCL